MADKMHEGMKASEGTGYKVMNAEGPFRDVKQRTAPGLFNDVDRSEQLLVSALMTAE